MVVKAADQESRPNQGERVDLSWLDSVDPETERYLLPVERAILTALRRYRAICLLKPTKPACVTARS